jgi:hypothetical protein
LDPVYTIAVSGLPNTAPSGGASVTEQTDPMINLYRMFNGPAGEYFYTTSNVEKQQLLNMKTPYYKVSYWTFVFFASQSTPTYWTYDGNIGHIYNYQAEGTVPLYRLYNSSPLQ